MMKLYRNLIFLRILTAYVLLSFFFQTFGSHSVYALTSGPSEPEVQSFEPVGTTDMVNLATGDFTYNIPLLSVGHYPINIAYHAGVGLDQEASMVGLGWTLNPGSIIRDVQGLPDDFKGDEIKKKLYIAPNETYSFSPNATVELFGWDVNSNPPANLGFSAGLGVYTNTYRGLGLTASIGIEGSLFAYNAFKSELNGSLGFNLDSHQGVTLSPSLSFSTMVNKLGPFSNNQLKFGVATRYNSRSGLDKLTLRGAWSTNLSVLNLSNGFLGGAMSFSSPSMLPSIRHGFANYAYSYDFALGKEAWGVFPGGQGIGSYSSQKLPLREREKTVPGVGYLYLEEKESLQNPALDFNRIMDQRFIHEATPNLAASRLTFDSYSVMGQGAMGMFRPYRSDLGIIHDQKTYSSNISDASGLDIGIGKDIKIGANISNTSVFSTSGNWEDKHLSDPTSFFTKAKFLSKDEVGPKYEPYYFAPIGEMASQEPENEDFIERMGKDKAARIDLEGDNLPIAKVDFEDDKYTTIASGLSNIPYYFQKRQKRNSAFSILTGDEAAFTLEPVLDFKGLNADVTASAPVSAVGPKTETRVTNTRKGHHITEASVLRPDGVRYVYGLPAYNTLHQEVSFNISGNTSPTCGASLIEYTPGSDNAIENGNGMNEYFQETERPPYAYAYLLTAQLSPDYVDLQADGPTDDDLGGWAKFNYSQVHDGYRWRAPYGDGQQGTAEAQFNAGLYSDPNDDMASYSYGEKEVYLVNSIETKDYIAEFKYFERADGLGVLGPEGEKDDLMKKYGLESITLYSKKDRQENLANATILKKIWFYYDYSLCPGVPNYNPSADAQTIAEGDPIIGTEASQSGKLTLKRIEFSYGNSNKARINSYQFEYNGENPAYEDGRYDRWGNYQGRDRCAQNLTFAEYPYVAQDDPPQGVASVDELAAAWSLTDIHTPSGGTIKVEYEADDYAYVQDKEAMMMVPIEGFDDNNNSNSPANKLYDWDQKENYNFLYLPEMDFTHSSQSQMEEEFKEKYLRDLSMLYFNTYVRLKSQHGDAYDYVQGYAKIEDFGVIPGSNNQGQPWIQLKRWTINDKATSDEINPIAKTAFGFLRLHRPELVNPRIDTDKSGFSKALAGAFNEMRVFFKGFNRTLRARQYCDEVDLNKSWVRLYVPNFAKKASTHRVKKISLEDN